MKRGTVLILLITAIVPLVVSCRSTLDSDAWPGEGGGIYEQEQAWTPQEGFEHLCSARKFAFGGVGFAGITSGGEFAFRAVLKSPKAAEFFRDACVQATKEGKLYALCGLRKTDREAYNYYVAKFQPETTKVRTQSGCVGQERPMSTVVQEIVDGTYDSHFAEK